MGSITLAQAFALTYGIYQKYVDVSKPYLGFTLGGTSPANNKSFDASALGWTTNQKKAGLLKTLLSGVTLDLLPIPGLSGTINPASKQYVLVPSTQKLYYLDAIETPHKYMDWQIGAPFNIVDAGETSQLNTTHLNYHLAGKGILKKLK